jgi:hypothetical protein
MRHFTKTHNDLKWLFPVADTKEEAEKVFKTAERNAENLAELAGVDEKDKDLAIDCFMKGYSVGLQMEMSSYVDKRIEQIFKSIFGFTKDYPGSSKQKAKWLRFMPLNQLLKRLAYGDSKYLKDDKAYQKQRAYLEKLFTGSAFDTDADINETLKLLTVD